MQQQSKPIEIYSWEDLFKHRYHRDTVVITTWKKLMLEYEKTETHFSNILDKMKSLLRPAYLVSGFAPGNRCELPPEIKYLAEGIIYGTVHVKKDGMDSIFSSNSSGLLVDLQGNFLPFKMELRTYDDQQKGLTYKIPLTIHIGDYTLSIEEYNTSDEDIINHFKNVKKVLGLQETSLEELWNFLENYVIPSKCYEVVHEIFSNISVTLQHKEESDEEEE